MSSNLTMEDIANMAGVSQSTVSLVINGNYKKYRIGKKTVERVQKIVKESNFKPNKFAQSFRLKKTNTIGFVIPDTKNHFFSQLANGFEQQFRKGNYHVFTTSSHDDLDIEKTVIKALTDRQVDGLIIASVANNEESLLELTKGIPTLYIDRKIIGKEASWITSDNYFGSYEIINHLCRSGTGEILYIGGSKDISSSINRLKGYQDALLDNDFKFDNSLVKHGEFTQKSGHEIIKEFHRKHKRFPEAVFTASFNILEGVLEYLNEVNSSLPKDIKIATFDDNPLLDYLSIKISSVRQNWEELTELGYDILSSMIDGKAEIKNLEIKPDLIFR